MYLRVLLSLNLCQGFMAVASILKSRVLAGEQWSDLSHFFLESPRATRAQHSWAKSESLRYFPRLWHGLGQEIQDANVQHGYREALGEIGKLCQGIVSGASAFASDQFWTEMPYSLHPTFVHQLQLRQPRAIAILAHIYALQEGESATPVNIWWMRNLTKKTLDILAGFISPEWSWAMKWPFAAVLPGADVKQLLLIASDRNIV